MSLINADNSNKRLQPREDFVRQLRAKAQEAAEASVHHAAMSQQYLDLSHKFSELAETAGSTKLEDLRQSLHLLEEHSKPPTTPSLVESAKQHGTQIALDRPKFHSSHTTESDTPAPMEPPHTDSPGPALALNQDTKSTSSRGTSRSHLNDSPPQNNSCSPNRRQKRYRQNTQKLVERARAAKLAAKGIVRVRAKRSDLKPRQRSATEELKKNSPSLATSISLFVVAVFLLSLITFQLEVDVPITPIVAAFSTETDPLEEPHPVEPPQEEQGKQTESEVDAPVEEAAPEVLEPEPVPPIESEQMAESAVEELTPPESESSTEPATADATSANLASIDHHSDSGRKALLQKFGGSQASESAVHLSLEWLASVQHPQGWWDFSRIGQCTHPGTINNPIGGTAYALLPFLAAGQTHQQGNYQQQVEAGLGFLMKIGVNAPAGYDLRGMINKNSDDKAPNEAYYVHGAATLALCEAYGITNDRRLKKPAEGAVKFIINSQDPHGGGWRYNPQEAGSTSVTATQVMALMSAKKAGIQVPDKTLQGVMHYLDSVQVDHEGRYGYEIGKKKYSGAITAMSLLCRMYLGWNRNDGDMRSGIALLDKAGPYENLYSLYFATQVMKNWGGEEWKRWNVRMRDDLVAIQEQEGPAKGSWRPRTGAIHAKQGGRLLTTALATLTLQVYYRYKPLLSEVTGSTGPTPAQ